MRIVRPAWLAVLLAACGSDPAVDQPTSDAPPIDEPDAPPPGTKSAFETCIAGGGAPVAKAALDNIHGPVESITTSGTGSVVILGSTDKSVKQWTMSGTSGSYQTPFTTDAGAIVKSLAHTDAMDVLGADASGMLHRWTLVDVSSDQPVPINDGPLAAVAVNGNGSKAVVGTTSGKLHLVDLTGSPVVAAASPSELTRVTAVSLSNAGVLVAAGGAAMHPMLEAGDGATAARWTDATIDGAIQAIAVAKDGSLVVAVGDGFVATFDPTAPTTPAKLTKLAGRSFVGVALLSGGANFVAASTDGMLEVFDVATAASVKTLAIPTPIGVVADRNGKFLYTSGPDGKLHVFGCE